MTTEANPAYAPGPWKTSEPLTTGTVQVKRDEPAPALLIADVLQTDRVYSAEANARLIAAAPELLEALEEIVEDAPTAEPDYDDLGGDTERAEHYGGDQEHWRCARIARAAIAKARGHS